MLGPRAIRNYFVASACMLVLASAPPDPGNEIIASITVDNIGRQDAEELECSICLQGRENGTDLFICPGSGVNLHALHIECLKRCKLNDNNHKKVCPSCMQNWETQLIKFPRKALEYSLLNCSEYKKASQSVKEISNRALNMEELKGILPQMIYNFRALLEFHEKFQNVCDRFLQSCPSFSGVYGSTSKDYYILRNQLSEIDKAFIEVEEDKLRKTDIGDFCRFLLNAPKCVYTENVVFFISTPIFFVQLDPQQITDFWVRLLTLTKESDRLKDNLCFPFEKGYIYHNLSIFDSGAVERILSPIEDTFEFETLPFDVLESLREFNVYLSPECRERLAKIALTDLWISIHQTIRILQELEFFTNFTKGMRDRVINYWKEERIREGDEQALEILYLKDSAIKPEGISEDKILELLEGLLEKRQAEEDTKILLLEFYRHILSYTPADNYSSGIFLQRIYKLLKPMREDAIFLEILPFLPAGTFEERAAIILGDPKEFRGVYLSMTEIVFLYSGVKFSDAASFLFNFIGKANNSNAGELECMIIKFGIFFRKDLENDDNARIFYDGLRKAEQHAMMLFFRQHFTGMPEYQAFIADKIDKIIKAIPYIEEAVFSLQILYALYDASNDEARRALYKNFTASARQVLDVCSDDHSDYHLFSSLLFHEIFARDDFSDCIEPEQIKGMITEFADNRKIDSLFEKYMNIYFSLVKEHVKEKALEVMKEISESSDEKAYCRLKVKAMLDKMSLPAPQTEVDLMDAD